MEDVCETKSPIFDKPKLVWEIHNSSVLLNTGIPTLMSKEFGTKNRNGFVWSIEACPSYPCYEYSRCTHSHEHMTSGYNILALAIRNLPNHYQIKNTELPAILGEQRKYSIPSINGKESYIKTFIGETKNNYWDVFLNMDDFGSYFSSSDTLTIVCEVTAYGRPVNTIRPKIEVPEPQIGRNLGLRLFESRGFSDVTLVASQKKEIRAHKAILASESTVFSAMFTNEMMETQENRVEVIDVEPEVLEEMLRFIYTRELAQLEERAFDLLAAAEKYRLQTLKENCEVEMLKNTSYENAVDVLIHTDLYQAQNLKDKAIDFNVRHFKEVKETASYKSMVSLQRRLLGELLKHM